MLNVELYSGGCAKVHLAKQSANSLSLKLFPNELTVRKETKMCFCF